MGEIFVDHEPNLNPPFVLQRRAAYSLRNAVSPVSLRTQRDLTLPSALRTMAHLMQQDQALELIS